MGSIIGKQIKVATLISLLLDDSQYDAKLTLANNMSNDMHTAIQISMTLPDDN